MILRFAIPEDCWLVFPSGVYGPSSRGHEKLYEEHDEVEEGDIRYQSAIEVGRTGIQRHREVYVRYSRLDYQPAQVVDLLLRYIPGLLAGIYRVWVEEYGGEEHPSEWSGSVDKEFTVEEFLDQ